MPSTTTYERGQVVVVSVPYSDQSGVKPRPALIVSTGAWNAPLSDVVVCPISSQPRHHRRPGPGDLPLRDWKAVGLRHPSTVRVSKVLAVDKRIISRTLGRLAAPDMRSVADELRRALGL
jgi:mRNA interferase MazF